MRAITFNNLGIGYTLKNKKQVREWLLSVIKGENFTPLELNFIFCNDDYLTAMNVKYLQHNTLTDVLTFDNSTQKGKIAGDIYISIYRVQSNAKLYRQTFIDELHRVMLHGLLHLCGFNDKSERAKKIMRHKEDEYLSKRNFI